MRCPAMTNMDRSKSPRTRATNCHFNSRLFRLFYFFNLYNKLPDMLSDEEVSVVVDGSAAFFLKS
jgi:hypothetical protein